MLQLKYLREQKESVLEGLRKRNFSIEQLQTVDEIIALDETRRRTQGELDSQRNENKLAADQIGNFMKSGNRDAADALKSRVAVGKENAHSLETLLDDIQQRLENLLITLPNIPHASVPFGKSADDNEVFKSWDAPLPQLPDSALPHWELAKKYNLFDLELGTKIAGAGFPLYRGKGAKLQRALINFFLYEAEQAGFEEIQPPLLVNADTARGTGQLPDKEGQMYYVTLDEFYLLPTAEVPVTNIYRGDIVDEKSLPIKMTGYTPCFRREAGSYGAHVRGLNRVHQFDKVEIVVIEHPDRSYDTLMWMVKHVSSLLEKLELPYRILRLCGGDMGFTSALTFDFEVWSAAQKRWLEVSSTSNFETFQSNRMKLRFRDGNGKIELAHTLNGSALALARIVAALLENNQGPDGIRIPPALQPFTRFSMID